MDRPALLRRALLLSVASILLNGVLGVTAVVVGLSTGSVSLLGFGLDAAIDSAASIALVWRFRIELAEPHRGERIERIAERIVGAVLLLVAAYLVVNSALALASRSHPESSDLRTALLIVAVLALPALSMAKIRTARALASGALRADGILTGIAAVLGGIGLVAIALTAAFDAFWADAVGALIVAAIITREGLASVRSSGAGLEGLP